VVLNLAFVEGVIRTYGRVYTYDASGSPTKGPWQMVTTDANGLNDMVMITTLAQVLLLNLGESPFFANYGIPAHQSVMQQVFPDYNVAFTQQTFASQFASLLVAKRDTPTPTYDIFVTTKLGVKLNASVPIPI
jgi:hypothetical protein